MSTPAAPSPSAPAAPAPAPAAPPAAASASLTPPPAAPAPSTPPAPSAAPSGDWTTTLTDDAKGYIQNKGFKTPGDVLESYRQLEKTFGVPQDRLLKLPENMDSPEGRQIMERLGMPKTPAEYGLDKFVPAEGGDPKLAEWASQVFHETGLPRTAAEKIITKWNERAQAAQKADKDNYIASVTQGEANLKKDWGAAYDANLNIAKAGAKALELKNEEIDALDKIMGRERLFKKLNQIGKGVGESGFVAGRPAADGALAPEQARQKLTELKSDQAFVSRFNRGDKDALAQMTKLQEQANTGFITI